jgi:hypothetical protein
MKLPQLDELIILKSNIKVVHYIIHPIATELAIHPFDIFRNNRSIIHSRQYHTPLSINKKYLHKPKNKNPTNLNLTTNRKTKPNQTKPNQIKSNQIT